MRISDWSSDVCSSDLDAVIHHDRVVQRIANDRQQRRDAVQIELDLGHGKEAEGQRHLVEQAAKRADTELPFEANPDIDGDAQHRERKADRAGAQQFFRHLARHRLDLPGGCGRSEEHTSELQSLMRISYAAFSLKTKKKSP